MEPKPIQDVIPPKAPIPQAPPASMATAPPPSGPELVGNIPVRLPSEERVAEQATRPQDHDSSFIIEEEKKPGNLPMADKKDNAKPKTVQGKPKPVAAIVVAMAAVICLAAGAYFEFLANR